MRFTYISVLSTDLYLDGILALNKSLKKAKNKYPLLVLTTDNICNTTIDKLQDKNILHKSVSYINNPLTNNQLNHWYYTFSKLHIFNMTEYDKVVYLDADMIIQKNIDNLFEKPHMSAVNAGGLLNDEWVDLNSGLMVIEPNKNTFNDMIKKINILKPEGCGDQDFLNSYYPEWKDKSELHLDHRYNIFHFHLDEYNEKFGYNLDDIYVIHYIGKKKPWNMKEEIRKLEDSSLLNKALKIWLACSETPLLNLNNIRS